MTPKRTRHNTSNRKATVWAVVVWSVAFCVLALAGGAGVGYFTDKGLFTSAPEPAELDSRFAFTGPVRERHLAFSEDEIIQLNRSARRAGGAIESIGVHMEIFTSREHIRPDDTLLMTMEFSTRTGEIIQSRPQETRRRHVVDRMARYTELAGIEYHRYHDMGVSFTFLWI
ncbi:hypothetical protein [Salidesulfovibrio onnuriiensis]|uniref:hypothetical protein n=1 Tax=Salidesulfovibrio onnuriiensis TaxID=2583823 RepID=UPI0011CA3A78|nr:hypothetical protein [Salidesulfovibrio onnuriiensis]